MAALGVIGFVVLVFLPGAWVTFGFPLSTFPFWARFLSGTMLAPLVVLVEFYMLRFLGASFELTTILLVVVNLPALYVISRHLGNCSIPDRQAIFEWILVLLIPFAFLFLQFFDPQIRAYSGHAWMHTDIIYMFANGDLFPEDPEVAGLMLGYPWAGHVYQAVLSYLLGSSPVTNYFWTNLLWLVFISGFAAGLVAELGGNRFSRITSVIWLMFGVNFVGYVLQHTVPKQFMQQYPIWGDYRYTPWLLKFFFFTQMPFALGIFIAIVYAMARPWPNRLTRYPLILVCLLLCSLGLIYPVLFLPACAVIGAKIVAILFTTSATEKVNRYKQMLALMIVILVSGLVTLTYMSVVTQDRVVATLVHFSTLRSMKLKAAESLIVLGPLIAGLFAVMLRRWTTSRDAITLLALGAVASIGLYVILHIRHWRNEYKFIFTAAICLAPFPSVALERVMDRMGRKMAVAFVIIIFILAIPFAHKMYERWPWIPVHRPLIDVQDFELRLDDKERFSRLVDAIRHKTPSDTILVLESTEIHFPTVTRRRLFVSPEKGLRPGVNLKSDTVLKNNRGYNAQLIEDRRLIVRKLFDGDQASRRGEWVDRILKLNRPVAIVVDVHRHAALLGWLQKKANGSCLYRGNDLILWLINPRIVSA